MKNNNETNKIRVGICGYGNLGKGCVLAVSKAPDMEVAGIFTRRNPDKIAEELKRGSQTENIKAYSTKELENMAEDIDVLILCGGSATDLIEQTPHYAKIFNTVDSFDTHRRIPEHFNNVDVAAKEGGNMALISGGWDPGLFSLNRLYAESVLPDGETYTFWGKGISQGHSDAIRRIEGVADARQYTIPVSESLESVRRGENPQLTTGQKHTRQCFVVVEDGADKEKIRQEIVSMPNYFDEYDTEVNFIDQETLQKEHSSMPHGGFVMRSGVTEGGDSKENKHLYEFKLQLDSNPEFTSSVLTAYARAVFRMNSEGCSGAKTVFDIPPAYLSTRSAEELRAEML